MTKNPLFKCSICGNLVELLHNGGGQLVCCGQPMEPFSRKAEEKELSPVSE